ncbi:phosphatase PAP2 family protein [Tengunoibacter tsumagoiensis]|uniref:phosphatase PAP2 family protein n=1 Tax=Tengunoibacter tsumagoiensis TaxID=2014871 RepID=UPI001386F5DC|nr:phosphatase PAP2 family protein [Tengunoibacter tsumagoiensis]
MKQQEPIKKMEEPVKKVEANVQNVVEQAQQEVVQSREPWYRVSRRGRILSIVYLVEFVLFTLLAVFVRIHPIIPVDILITQEFQESQMPWLHTFMVWVSYLGNAIYVYVPLILLTALVFWFVRLRLEALFIVGLSIISSLLNGLLKLIVNRPRPTANLVEIFQHATGQSFPSGHVMSYVSFFGLLFSFGLILFRRNRWWHYALLVIPALFVVLVGPSRIYLGDHWASDVIGGYLFGGLLLGLALWLYLLLKERGILTPRIQKPGEHLVEPHPVHTTH